MQTAKSGYWVLRLQIKQICYNELQFLAVLSEVKTYRNVLREKYFICIQSMNNSSSAISLAEGKTTNSVYGQTVLDHGEECDLEVRPFHHIHLRAVGE
jgi:hypothetical protein